MAVRLNPLLSFRDNAREALEFYQSVLGGRLTLTTFADLPMFEDPAEQDKILHGMLETDDGLTLMAADTPNSMEFVPNAGFSVALTGDDEPRLRACWERLSAGATITAPLEKAPWGDIFGMCTDRFGVDWMIDITEPSR